MVSSLCQFCMATLSQDLRVSCAIPEEQKLPYATYPSDSRTVIITVSWTIQFLPLSLLYNKDTQPILSQIIPRNPRSLKLNNTLYLI